MIYYYKINCLPKNLKLIREFTTSALRNMPLSDIEINQLVLAVDEICTNLMVHAHHYNPDEFIEVSISQFPEAIQFEIIDRNITDFDISQYKFLGMTKIIQEKRKGGLGLLLVHKIMDKVELKQENSQNTWRLLKTLPQK
ncbi:MAG: ATP-binding protein [Bacteroidetes bacterium]|nr:MAG: ATP-binding protein [Bacteroidota bacterium]TAG90293.1 MAG: ATP-binding protein [Bacteroidota bacterium]